jgi:hypothetical protein
MFHGASAAVVFTFIASVALVLSRTWSEPPALPGDARLGALRIMTVITPAVLALQYSLGGLLRHLGTALYAHVGTALVAVACIIATLAFAHRTRCGWLRRPAWLLGFAAFAQVLLGLAGLVAKFGFAPWGYVAIERSPVQIVLLTSHTVVGMVLVMVSVNLLLRVARIESARRAVRQPLERPVPARMPSLLGPQVLEGSLR